MNTFKKVGWYMWLGIAVIILSAVRYLFTKEESFDTIFTEELDEFITAMKEML